MKTQSTNKTNELVQANYDALRQIAQRFTAEADKMESLLTRVRHQGDKLKDEGWEGKGSALFQQEMELKVYPATRRLANALALSSRETRRIEQILREAEEEASSPFRGQGFGELIGKLNAAGRLPGTMLQGVGQLIHMGSNQLNAMPNWVQKMVSGGGKPAEKQIIERGNQMISAINEGKNWADFMKNIRDSGGFKSGLGKTLKDNFINDWKNPTKAGKAQFGAFTTILGEGKGAVDDFNKLRAAGVNTENALSQAAGKRTASTLIKLAASTNPITGSLVLLDEMLGTDIVGKVSTHAGKAADVTSTAIADAAHEKFHDPKEHVRVNYPRTAMNDYIHAGKPMPDHVAHDVFRGLVRKNGLHKAGEIWTEFAEKTGATKAPFKIPSTGFRIGGFRVGMF